MIESPEELDLLILKDYDSNINTYYLLNAVNGKSYITHLNCKVDIQDNESIFFVREWETLMERFSIPSKHHSYILFLTQTFYSKLEQDNLYFYDVQNAANAIDFFIGYLKEAEFAKIRGKFDSTEEAIDNKIHLQVKSPYSGLPVAIDYPGVTRLSINHLYKSIKAHDIILREPLHKFPLIPPIEVLNEIKTTLEIELNNPYLYYLLQTISLLQRYLNAYLSKELSRKQHLFIFELLYLFNFLQYAGKVNNNHGSDFILNSNTPANKFFSSKRVKDLDKTAFIKTLIKNSNRISRYYKSKRSL